MALLGVKRVKRGQIHNQLGFGRRPHSIYQYFNRALRLLGKIVNVLSIFCTSIPKRDLQTTPNVDVCPQSLGAMLEY